jgi:tetratricopeptide (TPR) repeat protein
MSLTQARSTIISSVYVDFTADDLAIEGTRNSQRVFTTCRYEALSPSVSETPDQAIVNFGQKCQFTMGFTGAARSDAREFSTALLRWKISTPEERRNWFMSRRQTFNLSAQYYRAANPKPPLSEDMRRLLIVADTAVDEKKFDKAAQAYEVALESTPWWPLGQFNAATILGTLQRNAAAVDHMTKYLILQPDASDSREATDKIYSWGGGVVPPWVPPVSFGANISALSREQAAGIHRPGLRGVYIGSLLKGSVGEKAGVLAGDVIVKFGNVPVKNTDDLMAGLYMTKPGSAVLVGIVRGAQELGVNAQF